jgi:hypothetical protein
LKDIFDISRIESLIQSQKIKTVLVIDSTILLDEPELTKWQTNLESPLFVMPCTLDLELEHFKNQPDSQAMACLASDQFARICSEGRIDEGVFREGAGWFISPPAPDRKSLEKALEELNLLARSLGKLNTQLVMLGREIIQKVPGISVVLVTRDQQVFNALQLVDIQSHLFRGFPLNLNVEHSNPAKDRDWDQILKIIQAEAEKKLVELSLTLTKKSIPPSWLTLARNQRTLIAEGKGILHFTQELHFTWAALFGQWDFPDSDVRSSSPSSILKPAISDSGDGEWIPGKVHLEINGNSNSMPSHLYQKVVQTILKCASPMAYIEDLPTLQEPLAILKQFLIFEYAFQERRLQGDIKPQDLAEMESRLKDEDNLLNWAYFWLHERQVKTEETDISFTEFLHAVGSNWNIGNTFKMTLLNDPSSDVPIGQDIE